ncbi:armadillo repeat-containing protein 5-like [Tigriopus californicus]|uniref:armadillo repeat-containing protein 5-like n=1 Tax=Tigriopus californicus TaxID=6832 RepID=UPI0027DA3B97|nr:armadillo repeat-containing protein 5-like [Tigriopus californicus]
MSDPHVVFDTTRRKEIPYLLSTLDAGQPSMVIYKSLSCLRSYFFSSSSACIHPKLDQVVSQGTLLKALLKLLEKPNAKIVDVTLSILGNLFLVESVRKQLYDESLRGISLIVTVLENITVESIICRVCRVIANLAQNSWLCHQFNDKQIFTMLVKATNESQFAPKTNQVIVRAVRILGSTSREKKNAIESLAIGMVANHLQTPDEDLLKAVTKCLAHYTHGCTLEVARQVGGDGYERYKILVELMDHPNRSIWEAAMAITVNLAYVAVLRPTLGNMGAIAALVKKLENRCELGLSPKEIAHCVTALCLFCRESVNRMKIRECNGLRLIVAILNDFALYKLFDRIVNSLLQFSFDSASLNTLQNEGLVQTLVSYIWAYTEKYGIFHRCSTEKGLMNRYCPNEDDPDLPHGFDPCGLPEMVDAEDVLDANDIPEDIGPPEPDGEDSNMEPVDLNDEEIAAMNLQDQGQGPSPPPENINVKEPIVFRVNSPSYQAVQDEYSEIMRRQEAMANSSWVRGPSHEAPSGPASPDRSPYPWMGSPEHSPGYSLEGSPVSLASRSPQKSPERGSPLTLPK